MRRLQLLLLAAFAFTLCSGFIMKDKDKPVYVYGIAASFADTVVYCTSIQLMDSVKLDKNGFLPEREVYAAQLKNYLEYSLQKPNYTCMIYFSENKNKLEKDFEKMKNKYRGNKATVQSIDVAAFSFTKPAY